MRTVIRQVISEFVDQEKGRVEPAYKAELVEERRRREQLERRVNELVIESKKSRAVAEEAERNAAVKSEFQRHGVTKLDLAFKAVRDEIRRLDDGRIVGSRGEGELPLRDFVEQFVHENPEFLPARISGGSGTPSAARTPIPAPAPFHADLDKIRPGMDKEDLERIRQEVARVALQTLSGR